MTEGAPRTGRLPGAYWRQWTASAISNLGDGMTLAAMPLLALSLTDDTRLIAAVPIAQFVPWLLLSLPAGVYTDRHDRRRLMIVANIGRTVIYGLIAVSAATGRLEIWTLLALVLLAGVCEVVFDNAAQTFLPEIVPDSLLPTANGRLYAAEVVTNVFLGLPLGAWLFVVAVGAPFTVDAATFAIAALLVASIRVPRREPTPAAPGATSFVTELAEGLRWLWTNRLLRTLAIMLGLTNLAFNIGQATFVVFATKELGVSDAGYGVLLAVMSIGAVVGGLMGDRILRRVGTSAALIGSYSVFVVGELGVGLAPTVWLVAIIAIVEALAGIVWNIITVSLRQQIVPNDLLGRVNSVYRWIGWGTIPIGAFIGGMVAHSVSLRAPFLLGSAVSAIGLLYGARELVPWRIDAALQRGPLAGLGALSLRPRS